MEDFISNLLGTLFSAAAVSAAIIFFGRKLFENYLDRKLNVNLMMREQTLKSQIQFKERQIKEFYFPIYARLKRGKKLYDLWEKGKLNQIESDILALFVQSNENNVNIILNKSELIEGDDIPQSYVDYLIHVAVWDPFLKKEVIEIPNYKEEGFKDGVYPKKFEKTIFSTTKKLKQDISELYKKYGLLK